MGLAPVASQLVRQAGWPIWLADWPTSQSGWLLSLVAGWLANQAACLANEPASQQPRSQQASQRCRQHTKHPRNWHMPIRWSCKPQLWQPEPRPESQQIEIPGTGFVVFWNQCQKVIKSNLLGLVLSTSGTKAGKLSNRPP